MVIAGICRVGSRYRHICDYKRARLLGSLFSALHACLLHHQQPRRRRCALFALKHCRERSAVTDITSTTGVVVLQPDVKFPELLWQLLIPVAAKTGYCRLNPSRGEPSSLLHVIGCSPGCEHRWEGAIMQR